MERLVLGILPTILLNSPIMTNHRISFSNPISNSQFEPNHEQFSLSFTVTSAQAELGLAQLQLDLFLHELTFYVDLDFLLLLLDTTLHTRILNSFMSGSYMCHKVSQTFVFHFLWNYIFFLFLQQYFHFFCFCLLHINNSNTGAS